MQSIIRKHTRQARSTWCEWIDDPTWSAAAPIGVRGATLLHRTCTLQLEAFCQEREKKKWPSRAILVGPQDQVKDKRDNVLRPLHEDER
jgi:hypothetical protein